MPVKCKLQYTCQVCQTQHCNHQWSNLQNTFPYSKASWSMSIRYRCDAKVSDLYQVDVDPMSPFIWINNSKVPRPKCPIDVDPRLLSCRVYVEYISLNQAITYLYFANFSNFIPCNQAIHQEYNIVNNSNNMYYSAILAYCVGAQGFDKAASGLSHVLLLRSM